MKLKLILLTACVVLVLQPAECTLLLKKKLTAAALAAGARKLGYFGSAPPAEEQTTNVEEATVSEVHNSESPAPQAVVPYQTIILRLPQPILQVQSTPAPEVQGSFISSRYSTPVEAPRPGIFGLLSRGIHTIPGNLASLWGNTQEAVKVQTNRLRDRFTPLRPLSQLLRGSLLRKPHHGLPIKYRFYPKHGLKQYSEIKYLPVLVQSVKETEIETPAVPEVINEISYPKTEYGTPVESKPDGGEEAAVDFSPPKKDYGVPAPYPQQIEYNTPAPVYVAPEKEYSVPEIKYPEPKAEYAAPVDAAPQGVYSAPKGDAALAVASTDSIGAPAGFYPPAEEYQPANVFRADGGSEFQGGSYRYTLVKA